MNTARTVLGKGLVAVPGVRLSSLRYRIRRWDATSGSVRMHLAGGSAAVPVAGPVPHAAGTPAAGVTAPLAEVASDQRITAANSAGRIVVRDASPGRVPYSVFFPGVLGTWIHDPGHTIKPDDMFIGDFLAGRVTAMRRERSAGARTCKPEL